MNRFAEIVNEEREKLDKANMEKELKEKHSMITVELFYRDGNNDKAWWEIEVDKKTLDKVLDVEYYDNEVLVRHEDIQIEDFGLTMMDIPFPFGYCPEFDHNFVNIMAIDGVEIDDYIKKLEKEIA